MLICSNLCVLVLATDPRLVFSASSVKRVGFLVFVGKSGYFGNGFEVVQEVLGFS